jgi:hypothetical protein
MKVALGVTMRLEKDRRASAADSAAIHAPTPSDARAGATCRFRIAIGVASCRANGRTLARGGGALVRRALGPDRALSFAFVLCSCVANALTMDAADSFEPRPALRAAGVVELGAADDGSGDRVRTRPEPSRIASCWRVGMLGAS